VALNCVANGKLLKKGIFKNIWIQPASGDAGGALGCAYCAYYLYFGNKRTWDGKNDKMKGSYLDAEFTNKDIKKLSKKFKAPYVFYEDFDDLYEKVAELLAEGYVVGWFQGRMEWGPRALGN